MYTVQKQNNKHPHTHEQLCNRSCSNKHTQTQSDPRWAGDGVLGSIPKGDDVFYLFLQKQKSAQSYIFPKGTSHHTRLFRGTSTNDIKKLDGPCRSWPTPHSTPFFLPREDPSPVTSGKNMSLDHTMVW